MNNQAQSAWWPRITGAILCLAVAAVHIIDQGGFPGSKEPQYVGLMYYALEVAGVLTAILLVAGAALPGWILAIGVAAAPFAGFVLSRGPGMPGYTNDMGHWTEPLGVISLVVEAALLVLAVALLARSLSGARGRLA